MARTPRLAQAPLAPAGLCCVLLSMACASAAAGASAGSARGPGFVGIERSGPEAPPPLATPSAAAEDEAGAARLAQLDHELAEIDGLLATAHFRTALALVQATRDRLDSFGDDPQLGVRRARLELMAATAEVALGRRSRARRSLMRALRADPGLALDEREASPKLLELLREARRRSEIAEPEP